MLLFQYWNNPGAFNQIGLEPTKPHLDRFLAIMSSIVQAAFGFSGIEIVSPSIYHLSMAPGR
jgi:amino acid transporter